MARPLHTPTSAVRGLVCILFLSATTPGAQLPQAPPDFGAPAAPPSPARGQARTGGLSSAELVDRALDANGELAAARLEVERARARVRQAGLRPNPAIDFEQRTGRLTGSTGEGEVTVGVAVPLELFGQRGRRVDLAEAELAAAEAEIADRERRLAAEVRARYAEALAARRELEITAELDAIDEETANFVEVRVVEGETAPLELNLLRAEIERSRSRRAVVEGRLEAAMLELKSLAGIPAAAPVALAERIDLVAWQGAPATLAEATEVALRSRPDLRLALLEERVAEAGLRLARAQSAPEVTAFSRLSVERSAFDDTPVGPLRDRDTTLAFGVSVGLPAFNRGQGAREEATAAIAQARRRRGFAEQRVRAEVAAAFARYRATEEAVSTFELGVIARSNDNIRSVRGAYQIGAYRVTELLAEQRRFVDTQREYIETLAERYRALADLQSALGVTAPFSERTPAARPEVTTTSAAGYPGLDRPPREEPAPVAAPQEAGAPAPAAAARAALPPR
jgi:cobalt-zinc-cadmium efflux system outer membrane protein